LLKSDRARAWRLVFAGWRIGRLGAVAVARIGTEVRSIPTKQNRGWRRQAHYAACYYYLPVARSTVYIVPSTHVPGNATEDEGLRRIISTSQVLSVEVERPGQGNSQGPGLGG
jgi:hypothetical protein